MADKWSKVRIGLLAAAKFAPCHVMVADADDCVSNRLASYCAENTTSNGWYVESGWMHDEGSRLIFDRRKNFDAICGTSSIVRVTPEDLAIPELGTRDDHVILRGGHTRIREEMRSEGRPLAALPFRGAVYNLATGENHTGFSLTGWRSKKVMLQKFLSYRLLTQRIRSEFGLYDVR